MTKSMRATFLVALACGLPGVTQAQHTGCRAPDASTTRILEYVKDLVREPDALTDSLGVAGVDSSLIVSETDSTACVRVAQVVDSVFEKTTVRPYVVIRAGTRYFAYAPSNDSNKPSQLVHVVDNLFVYRETVAAF